MTYSSFPDPGEVKRDKETLKRERDLYQEVKEQDEIDEALKNMEENRKKINWEVDGNDLTEVDPYAGDNFPEDTNVSDVNLFGTALKGVQKVGEGLDWVDKQVGVGDFNVYNARQTIIRPLSEVHVALGILGEFLIPDSTDIATFGLGYIPKRFLKAPKVWARAVLAMKAADVPKVRAQTLALATGAGTNFGVPVLKVEGVGDAISTFKKNAQRIKVEDMPKTTRALFKNPKNTAKLSEFTANTPETYKKLEHYAASAVADMQSRIAQGRKRALLKDWEGPILGIDPKTKEYIRGDWLFKDDAGTQWLYTRTGNLPDYSKLDGADLAKALAESYSIVKYDDVLIEIAKKGKWDEPAKHLAELRKIFNAEHDYWNKINPHIFKHMMMDYGVKGAYLEHKVQRAANWFWPHPRLAELKKGEKLTAAEKAQHLTNRQ